MIPSFISSEVGSPWPNYLLLCPAFSRFYSLNTATLKTKQPTHEPLRTNHVLVTLYKRLQETTTGTSRLLKCLPLMHRTDFIYTMTSQVLKRCVLSILIISVDCTMFISGN